jgi:hypothetical protein
MIQSNFIAKNWENIKINKKEPRFCKGIFKINSKDFTKIFSNKDLTKKLILKLYNGYFVLIKNVYNNHEIENLINKVLKIESCSKENFFKLNRKIPNFYRRITKKISKKYSVPTDRTSWYFFRWNKESNYYYKLFDPLWDKVKLLNGLKNHYKKNTPLDKDHVDRIQVVRYPHKSGFIKSHSHPSETLFLAISVYLSQKKIDFKSGGTFFLKNKNKKMFVENEVCKGDVGIFYGSLYHGVDKFLVIKKEKIEPKRLGRWWVGLYSPESDLKKNRLTSAVK